MNDPSEKKARAAAVAGLRVALTAIGFLTLLWVIYLAVLPTPERSRPRRKVPTRRMDRTHEASFWQ
jgi:hypothetical protein